MSFYDGGLTIPRIGGLVEGGTGMMWDWKVWRCFDEARETFEEKGWGSWLPERLDNEVVPLLADSGEHRIASFARGPGSGECVFELRGKRRPIAVFIRDMANISAPEDASAALLNECGDAPIRSSSPDGRALYEPPTAIVSRGAGPMHMPA